MLNQIVQLTKAKRQGSGYVGHCPAHEDKKPSLSITEGDDGKVLVYCHRGCSQEAVIDALEARGAWDAAEQDRPSEPIVYDYLDESGNKLFCKMRYPGKNWSQARYTDTGIEYGLKDCRRVLYNLPGIEQAKAEKKAIFFVEGEKDAETLIALGLTATTNESGAGKGKVKTDQLASLTGAIVILMGDNDDVGIEHMACLGNQLKSYAAKVIEVRLPLLVNNVRVKDITDYLDATGGGIEEVKALAREGKQIWPHKVATSYQELMALDLPDPITWMGGFIGPSEATLLVALPGVGKTWFALACAMALADGNTAIGPYKPEAKLRVLIVDFEMGPVRLRQRLEALRSGYGIGAEVFDQIGIMSPELCQLNNLSFDELAKEETEKMLLAQAQEYDLIIIDNINAAYTMSEEDENSPKFWVKPQTLAFALKRANKASMFIHHATKGNPKNPAGSGKNTRFFDNVIALVDMEQEEIDQKVIKVHFNKSRNFYASKSMQPELQLMSIGNRTYWNDRSSLYGKSLPFEPGSGINWGYGNIQG